MASIRLLVTAVDYRPRLGGVATCGFELCRELSKIPGVELTLIAPKGPGCNEIDSQNTYKTLRVSIPQSTTLAIFSLFFHLKREIRRSPPDALFHFQWIPCAVAAYWVNVFSRKVKIPYFILVHGVEMIEADSNLTKKVRKLLSFVKRAVFSSAEHIFAVSHFTANLVSKTTALNINRIKVVYNGVNSDFFKPGQIPRVNSKKKTLLTVCRLEDYKGIDYTLKALRHVIPTFSNLKYLIVGVGKDRTRLEELVIEYSLKDHVEFLGATPINELPDLYEKADWFILLSREDWITPNVEGFGLVYLEAAACGTPSIAGNSGGIPDAVIDGKTGWLVDPTDERAIAAKILHCFNNPLESKEIANQAFAHATKTMTWQRMAVSIHQEVLQKRLKLSETEPK